MDPSISCQSGVRGLIPAISIVIPTFQREETLQKSLARLARCSACRIAEVIVIDQTPSSRWLPMVNDVTETFFSFRRLFRPIPNLPAARNFGASMAQAEIILFLDDDLELERSFIVDLLEVFQRDLIDVLGGDYVESFSGTSSSDMEALEWLPGGHTALRREHFFTIGGYDENMPAYNEDAEFCHRLGLSGLRIARHKGLRVIHHHEPTGGTWHHPSLFKAARTVMRSDLYFWHALGKSFPQLIRRALVTIKGESLGFGRIKVGSTATRVLACALSVPGALIYAFQKPQLLNTD